MEPALAKTAFLVNVEGVIYRGDQYLMARLPCPSLAPLPDVREELLRALMYDLADVSRPAGDEASGLRVVSVP